MQRLQQQLNWALLSSFQDGLFLLKHLMETHHTLEHTGNATPALLVRPDAMSTPVPEERKDLPVKPAQIQENVGVKLPEDRLHLDP